MPRLIYLLGGLFLVSGCLEIQFGRHVQAAPKGSTSVVECVFVDGFFKGNGFIYKINQDRTKIRLLKAFEISEDGTISNFNENADMTFISNENDVLTFADTRLQDVEGIIYQEKLDFNTMTSTTLTIEKVDGLEQVIETDLSKCSHVKL